MHNALSGNTTRSYLRCCLWTHSGPVLRQQASAQCTVLERERERDSTTIGTDVTHADRMPLTQSRRLAHSLIPNKVSLKQASHTFFVS
jgi:hypothetical protein